MYGHGISQTGELVDMAVDKDIIDKSGSWYSYGDERIGQGRENAKTYLAENTDKMEEIKQKVRAAYNMDGTPDEEVAENDDEANKSEDKSTDKSDSKAKKGDDNIDLKLDSDKKDGE